MTISLPDDIIHTLNQFLEISYDEIKDGKYQLFYMCIKIYNHYFKNEYDSIQQSKNKVINEILNSLDLETVEDKELILFLGLFYGLMCLIIPKKSDIPDDRLQMAENCEKFWVQLDKFTILQQ